MEIAKEKHIVLLGAVTLAGTYQLGEVFRKVGKARQKYGVTPPEIEGPEEFKRIYRAQVNYVEFYGLYLGSMWTAGIFFHPVPAAAVGAMYLVGRHKYIEGYARSAEGRVPGFMLCVRSIQLFYAMCALGVGQHLLVQYANIDLKTTIFDFFKNLLGR